MWSFYQHKIFSLNILIIVYLFQNAKRYRDRSHRRVQDIGVRLLSRLQRETQKTALYEFLNETAGQSFTGVQTS